MSSSVPLVDKPDALSTQEDFYTECLSLLEFLVSSAKMAWNPTQARESLVQAQRDTLGDWDSAWSNRLKQVGADLGMLVDVEVKTTAQALETSYNQPLVTFGGQHWIALVSGRVGTITASSQKAVQWRSASELVSLVGAKVGSVATAIEWVSVGLSRPCEPLQQKTHDPHHHRPPPLRRLFVLLRQERNDIRVIILFSLGIGIFSLATPIAVEAIVSTVQGGTQILLQPVIALSIVLLIFLALAAILRVNNR